MTEPADARAPQYLSFTIAGTDYALPILAVKEILQHEEPTRVPGAPAAVRGVIDLRGAVVPVLDLAVKFGRGETAATSRTCILAVEAKVGAGRLTLGVLADQVNEVLDLPATAVAPPPAFGTGVRLDYLTGMGRSGDGFVLLLDVDRVASASEVELAAHAEGRAGGPPAAAEPSAGLGAAGVASG